MHPSRLPSWLTPLPPVPGSTLLGLRPCVLPDPGAEVAHYWSVSGQDLVLGKKQVTLQQLSIFQDSPRRLEDGWFRLGLQPWQGELGAGQ